MNLADLNDDNYKFRGLFKSEPGSGKSIAAASFPEPVYFFDLEGRMRSISNYYRGMKKDISFDTYRKEDLIKLVDKLEAIYAKCNYASVIIDPLTYLADMALMDMIRQKSGKTTKDGDAKGKKVGRFDVPVLEDYGGEAAILTQIILALAALPCHIVLTAHVVNDPTSKTAKRKLLTGGSKVAAKIPGLFDEKYHFFTEPSFTPQEPPKYKVLTSASGEDFAGTALILPVEIDITNIGRYGNPGFFDLIWKLHTTALKSTDSSVNPTV
jgi:hypothetical protein